VLRTYDGAVKEQHEQKASSEDQQEQPEESERCGVRAEVSDLMKGNRPKRYSCMKTSRRQLSTLSQTRAPWRN